MQRFEIIVLTGRDCGVFCWWPTLGKSISSTPLSKRALTSSAFASRGSRMARVTVPYPISRRWIRKPFSS